jgi:hypothetical protein
MKAVLSFLAVLLCLVATAEVQAHGGGLDAYGCHHNRKLGGYHCHRGPLAGRAFASKEEMLRVLRENAPVRPAPQPPQSPTGKGGKP